MMADEPIIPLILSGGPGTRLWPLSRNSKPKQFLKFGSERSLIQETILRCGGPMFDPRPIIVSADSHRFMVAEELRALGISADILLEPMRRDSCAAIVAGCLCAIARSKDAFVLALAADHLIPDVERFSEAVAHAKADAGSGYLVTFGIKPTHPATGYGYILPGESLRTAGSAKVERFVEKPDEEAALRYIREGYLWNSGNFLFRANAFVSEIELHAPDVLKAIRGSFQHAQLDLDFLRLEPNSFARSPQVSVDYAVMEKTPNSAVFPVDYHWSDIGSWEAVWEIIAKDGAGNAMTGRAVVLDGRNNLIHSEQRLTAVVGVDELVVVTTRDAVLVARKSKPDQIKVLVEELKERGFREADEALQIFRPWGNFERLDIGDGYQVKRVVVSPGSVRSSQEHKFRAEHWTVVQGRAEVTIGNAVKTVHPGESVYIPIGEIHGLANLGTEPIVLIEVQSGNYLGEEDTILLEDMYNRGRTYTT